MLQAMRSTAKYIWIFIVIAFIGGFLLVESSGLLGRDTVSPTTAVATVNGDDVLATTWTALTQQLETQQTSQGAQSITLDERARLSDQAFNQLVNDLLIQQEIERRGITVTDDEIAEAARSSPPPQLMQSPELQTNGQFDYQKYLRFLASPAARTGGLLNQLESYYRTEIPKQKLFEQVTADVYPSDQRLWTIWRDANDSAQVTFAALRPSEPATAAVSDQELRAYYDANKADLKRPARAVVTFTYIPRVATPADSAAARARALALRARIVGGEKFEDVAKAESSDSASAAQGGDLGKGGRGRFVAPFESAAYALAPGEISQPVLTPFGYHLIRVDSRSGDTLSLRHILVPIAQNDSAASRTDRKADSLSRMASAATDPARFDSAVRVLGLPATRGVATEGQPLVVGGKLIPSVAAWAFGGARSGETSELFDAPDGYYLARLDSLSPGGTPELSAVRDQIRGVIATRKALAALVPAAAKFATVASASSLEQAGRALNTQVVSTRAFTRVTGAPGLGRTNEAVGAAFGLPIGVVSAPVRTQDAVYVLRVDRRVPASRSAWEAQKDEQRRREMAGQQQDHVRMFLANLRDAAKIADRRTQIEAAIQRQQQP